MQLTKIIESLECRYPKDYALEWDNVGLLAGRADKEITRIYVALDATDAVIDDAKKKGADLLVTHHPLIFAPMKQITSSHFIGNRLIRLIQNDISYYVMHTNYDVLRMSELSAITLGLKDADVLKVTLENGADEKVGIGKIANLESAVSLAAYCEHVKASFQLDTVKVFESNRKKIQRVAVSPGSGSSVIEDAIHKNADVLVTGDIDHHTGIDAAARGLHIIDAGHYGIEHIFIKDAAECLSVNYPELAVTTAPIVHPFRTV